MTFIDLYALRQNFNSQGILLCFNGPISHGLLEELGQALRNYMQADRVLPSRITDVFGTYIELMQNIRHYAAAHPEDESLAMATLLIAKDGQDRYVISAGNVVESADGARLIARIRELAGFDAQTLRAAYKEQLRKPRVPGAGSGAGLGLIEIARKANEPLRAALTEHGPDRSFFSLRACV